MKKMARELGIPRWPYRRLNALQKRLDVLESVGEQSQQIPENVENEISEIREEMRMIRVTPSILLTGLERDTTFISNSPNIPHEEEVRSMHNIQLGEEQLELNNSPTTLHTINRPQQPLPMPTAMHVPPRFVPYPPLSMHEPPHAMPTVGEEYIRQLTQAGTAELTTVNQDQTPLLKLDHEEFVAELQKKYTDR
jgi:hypothetical protein